MRELSEVNNSRPSYQKKNWEVVGGIACAIPSYRIRSNFYLVFLFRLPYFVYLDFPFVIIIYYKFREKSIPFLDVRRLNYKV